MSKLLVVNTVLVAGAFIASLLATCSNDRLEEQVIALRKAVDSRGFSGGGGDEEDSIPPDSRVAGAESPIQAVGWGGVAKKIRFVEGAAPDAPLSLQGKGRRFRPQNDWYVQRRPSPPKTLNYYASNEADANLLTAYIYGRLMTVDPDAPPKVKPSLATSWEVAEDKLTYVYRLRKGVQFADGRPFTSADVKFSFDVLRDPKVQANHLVSNFEDVEEVTTPDEHTVVVKYKKRYWKGLYSFGYLLRILNKGWYEEQIPKYAQQHKIEPFSVEPGKPGFGEVFRKIRVPSPGAGPYYLQRDEDYTNTKTTLVQNPFYFGIQLFPEWYNFTRLQWVYIADDVAANESFRKEQFDIQVVEHDQYEDQLKDDPTITRISNHYVYDHTGLHCNYVGWNCREAPFDDPRVRTAMTHLMDREWIVQNFYRGNAVVAVCHSKPAYPTYSHDLKPHPFDPAAARRLLAEAGWTDTDGDGVLDRGGKRFEFVVKGSSAVAPFTMRVMGRFKDELAKVGIRMDIQLSEWATFIEDFELRRFSACVLGSSWGDPWIDIYEEFHSSQDIPRGGNAPGWHTPEVDRLLEGMRDEFDDEKRTAMFHRFNRLFYDAQPQTLLVHPLVSVVMHKRFQLAKVRPTGMQIHELWVRPQDVLHK